MSSRLEWVIDAKGAEAGVKLSGPVNEDADFAPLVTALAGKNQVSMDLGGINRVNSCGVREWVNFMRKLPNNLKVKLEQCSPPMVNQINTISNFVGLARVVSVQAPFMCDKCGRSERVVVSVESGRVPDLANRACPHCAGKMEFDDLEDSYFAFLRRG
ncbi:MAG: hypothetical protein HY903_11165 [Deltaproteobacteria bacterium]|nr:hypothetical protein [Deltaproteobacteria bacterium]